MPMGKLLQQSNMQELLKHAMMSACDDELGTLSGYLNKCYLNRKACGKSLAVTLHQSLLPPRP